MKPITRAMFMSPFLVLFVGGGLGIAVAEIPVEHENVQRFIPQGPEAGADLFPPNPKPGGCYARALVPAKYETETLQMLKSEASERLEIVPATFQSMEETIIVQEAAEKLEIVPATYEWVQEQVLVKPAFEKLESVPAEYELVSEQVIDKPAHVVWEKGRGLIEKVDFATGEIVCLKEIPATYKTVTKQILKSPATTRAIEVSAEYKTVKRRVMKTPPTTMTIAIPEETQVQKVLKVVEPATVKRIAIPEEFQTFTKRVKVSAEKMAWKPVLCETNTTPQVLRQLQYSLKELGFNPGPLDGSLGTETMKAVVAFQKDNGLTVGGLTAETFQALKVDLPWVTEAMAINTGGGEVK